MVGGAGKRLFKAARDVDPVVKEKVYKIMDRIFAQIKDQIAKIDVDDNAIESVIKELGLQNSEKAKVKEIIRTSLKEFISGAENTFRHFTSQGILHYYLERAAQGGNLDAALKSTKEYIKKLYSKLNSKMDGVLKTIITAGGGGVVGYLLGKKADEVPVKANEKNEVGQGNRNEEEEESGDEGPPIF